jgi:hypothetical protein
MPSVYYLAGCFFKNIWKGPRSAVGVLALLTQHFNSKKGGPMEDLIALVMAANNVDISFIEGRFDVHIIEKSGKLHHFKCDDLPWGIHNIKDELLD